MFSITKNEVIQKVITIALNEVGYIEKKSNSQLDNKTANAGSANYTKYGRDMHNLLPSIMDFPAAWCDAFVDWCFYTAYGAENAKKLLCGNFNDYTVSSAQQYKNAKAWYTSGPKAGDQIFFKNSQRINHTGLVYMVDEKSVYTVEGNTSAGNNTVIPNGGCVAKKSYSLNNMKIAGYGRPNYSVLASSPVAPPPSNNKVIREIIDVSKYNTVDFIQASTKYKDVIIRVGYRSYEKGILTLDPKFVDHSKNALLAGMKIGVYFYDQSLNETEAVQQADFVAGLIKALPISYPVYIDSEYSNKNHNGRADNISKEQRTKNIIAFCERIKQLGYQAGVYASDSWFKSMVDFSRLTPYSIWCARYSTNKPTVSRYDIWQYGSAYIPGSSAPIDVNRLYIDFPAANNEETPSIPDNTSPSYCTVTASALNVRDKPSAVTGKILYSLPDGQALNVYSLTNGWCKISVSEDKWCSYKYIHPTPGKVTNCSKLNCRQKPSSDPSSNVLFVLKVSDEINILSETNGWYYIETNGRSGYVSRKYIAITS